MSSMTSISLALALERIDNLGRGARARDLLEPGYRGNYSSAFYRGEHTTIAM